MTQLYTSIGLTALPYSGKTTVSDVLVAELGYKQISHSAILRDEALRRGATLPLSRDAYMQTYFQMIDERGPYVLAEMALARVGTDRGIIFDGMRSTHELDCYRANLPRFFSLGIAVASDIETSRRMRYAWMQQSQREDVSKMIWEEFVKRDEIEWGEHHPFYSVKKCIERSDAVLLNNGSPRDLEAKTRDLIAMYFE